MNGGVEGKSHVYAILSREDKLHKGVDEDYVIGLVDDLLHNAIVKHASDIHLQPSEQGLVVRYRIDGVLYDQQHLDATVMSTIISRVKVLANLDIAERRFPQDGRFRGVLGASYQAHSDALIDFRVATFPTLYGEKIVIRLLDRSLRLLALESLGLQSSLYEQLMNIKKKPHGLLLVTGPTGCGKTTMLYALISAMDINARNIVTIENPIEYELAGIVQSQINQKIGFTFENGLRAVLRQDPDVIMVGEIRDKVTAHTAIEAALTGHLVLSTLHTNDALSAVARLLEMGIEPFLISATVIGVLAQRLARRLCDACKKIIENIEIYKQTHDSLATLSKVYVPQGCRSCFNLGYRGRIGLFELVVIDDALRSLIINKADIAHFRRYAQEKNLGSLFQDGIAKVKQGITSIDELMLIHMDAEENV